MKVSRRDLLAGAAGVVALGKTAASRRRRPRQTRPRSGASQAGRSDSARRPKNLSDSARSVTSSGTPHQDLYGTITPADLHFERHHGGVPEIDPEDVFAAGPRDGRAADGVHARRPQALSRRQPRPLPRVLRELRRPHGPAEITPQQLAPLTSNSEWTGVALATLFREVGARPQAKWFLAEGQDAALLTRSIPIAKAYDDALIAYGQNGEAIRPEQGYPARLFLPGWEGNASVKWIRRIELSDRPFMTREETSKYTDPMADGTARIFSFLMDARSLITYPAYPVTLEPRLGRDQRHRVDRLRKDPARRHEHRRRRDVDGGEAAGAGAVEGAHAVPASVELDRRRGGDHEPRRRRDRLRAADAHRFDGLARRQQRRLPLQPDHRAGSFARMARCVFRPESWT